MLVVEFEKKKILMQFLYNIEIYLLHKTSEKVNVDFEGHKNGFCNF